uniref:Vitelline membrane outer layer protein 1-like n=1 Tax=Scophthalmus maximus TaxID=52904 RepID=A0A8D3CUL0_SCOMX
MANLLGAVAVLAALSGGLCEEKAFLQRAGAAFSNREYSSLLTVNNGERFGNWTWPEMCPDEFFAVGFSVRVESNQYGSDDTALNGIRLICSKDGNRSFLYSIESHTGYFGDWSPPQYCPSGVLTSFQIRVEPHQGLFGDDTAVNSIKFRCSSNPTLEGTGMDWGGVRPLEPGVPRRRNLRHRVQDGGVPVWPGRLQPQRRALPLLCQSSAVIDR